MGALNHQINSVIENRIMKRLFDLIFSTIILVLFTPFGFFIIIILKFTGEGEIFYIQSRIGKDNKEFGIFKFATMIKNSPNLGAGDITIKNDPRVLPFGKFLRKTKLNEFPQFINVFLGSMSLVGPRPLVKNQNNLIPKIYKDKISKLKPGITGIGSIIFRDEEQYLKHDKNLSNEFYKNEIVPFKSQLESWYHDNKSILLDFILLFITAFIVIKPKTNVYNRLINNIPKHPIFNPS